MYLCLWEGYLLWSHCFISLHERGVGYYLHSRTEGCISWRSNAAPGGITEQVAIVFSFLGGQHYLAALKDGRWIKLRVSRLIYGRLDAWSFMAVSSLEFELGQTWGM